MKVFTFTFLILMSLACTKLGIKRDISSKTEEDKKTSYTIENDSNYQSEVLEQNEIYLSKSLNKKEKRVAIELLKKKQFNSFINSLAPNDQYIIQTLFQEMADSHSYLLKIIDGTGSPIVLINGLDIENFPFEYIRPIKRLIDDNRKTFAFRWSKKESIENNSQNLIDAFKTLKKEFPNQKITVFAYSAGGAVAIVALDKILENDIFKDITFHTIASPLYGYGAPIGALFAVPFVGSSTIAIGRGIYKKINHSHFKQCFQWINTNCELDQHACDYDGINPQLGLGINSPNISLCGTENTTLFRDENHASILNKAFFEVMNNEKKFNP